MERELSEDERDHKCSPSGCGGKACPGGRRMSIAG